MKQYVQFSGATQPLHEVESNGDYYKVEDVQPIIDAAQSVVANWCRPYEDTALCDLKKAIEAAYPAK